MRDLIDPTVLRHALDTTMQRYPYFCVELQKKEGQYVFLDNPRPVVISNSLHGVELNAAESNYHMIAFAYQDNWIILDVFHGLTDATGAYEVIRTLLYYYCSERYGVELKDDGIRLAGDEISMEEWVDPVETAIDLPMPTRSETPKALNVVEYAKLQDDRKKMVYSIALDEAEFIHFSMDNDGSPGTITALFISRAVAKLFPTATDPIRVSLCVNQRKALHKPLAHQSLVGAVMLEYKDKMRDWPLNRQATAYRGMVFAQTRDEAVLAQANGLKGLNQMILSKETDQERLGIVAYFGKSSDHLMTASVSYTGKANYKEAEKYIRDFRTWTVVSQHYPLVEIAAVNGRFTLDFIQPFSNPLLVNAFLKELEDNGITYDLQDVSELELPNILLSWSR
ncbi:MAG: hypothetical protein IJT77_02635 [Clostridia bacterium]|nr:hypothetical protein [Clostridia bacterium]